MIDVDYKITIIGMWDLCEIFYYIIQNIWLINLNR